MNNSVHLPNSICHQIRCYDKVTWTQPEASFSVLHSCLVSFLCYPSSACECVCVLCAKRSRDHSTSQQQRRVDLLTIASLKSGPSPKKQHVVFIMSRIHPGETPTSFVCQGLIDFLVSSHPIAVALREHVTFKIVPIMNPDGVFLGNSRCSLMGYDLNRKWDNISKWAHPTLHAVNNLLTELDQSRDAELDFVIDMHAHSSLDGIFLYGSTYDDVYRYERHIVFPKLLAQNAEDYNNSATMFNRDPSKAGTARRHFCNTLKESTNCYTLEVSFYGYQRQNGPPGIVQYTEDSYYRLGRNIARTFLDFYRAVNVIPANLPAQLVSSSPEPRRRARSSRSPSSRPRSRPRTVRSQAVLHLHDLTASTDRGGSSSSDGGSPVRLTPHSPPRRQRSAALLHYPELPVPGVEPAVPSGARRLTGRKVTCRSASNVVRKFQQQEPAPPRLAIIDFNKLTRGGLDQATGRGRGRTSRGKGKSKGRNSRKTKSPNVSPPEN